MIDDLAELVAMYNEGSWAWGDFVHQVTLLIPEVAVHTIIDQLPDALRDDFVTWLRTTYENDVPADSFVSIGRQSHPEQQRIRLELLRAWLRAHPSSKNRQ